MHASQSEAFPHFSDAIAIRLHIAAPHQIPDQVEVASVLLWDAAYQRSPMQIGIWECNVVGEENGNRAGVECLEGSPTPKPTAPWTQREVELPHVLQIHALTL